MISVNKTKNIFFLFLSAVFTNICLLSFSQNYSVSGKIIDSQTKENLAFVNISVNGKNTGVATDIDGKFTIKSNENIQYLKISYVGYKPLSYNITDKTAGVLIKLDRAEIELSEVVIHPGENPAHSIINKAVENRDINNPENLQSFSYTSYNKMTFTFQEKEKPVKPSSDTINKTTDTTKVDSADIKIKKLISKQHLFLTESVSERKFIYPDKNKETVTASRTSGFKIPFITILATQLQSFSFYQNVITIMDRNYINPVSNGSTEKYLFVIEDTTYNNNDTVYIISFRPKKTKNFDGLKGVLYINTGTYAIQNVIAEPYEDAYFQNLGYTIKIQQKYEQVEGKWFPIQLNTDIIYLMQSSSYDLIGSGKSYLENIRINPDLSEEKFNNVILKVDTNAAKKPDGYWNMYRTDSLTKKDIRTYENIDSLGEKLKFDRIGRTVYKLSNNKLGCKFFDFDLNKFIRANRYEDIYLGVGIHTNEKNSRFFNIGGYWGYGFKDETAKYGGDINFFINKPSELTLNFSYINDISESGGVEFYRDNSLISTERIRDVFVNVMDKIEKKEARISFRTLRYMNAFVALSDYTKTATNDYTYKDMRCFEDPETTMPFNKFHFTDISIGFRYAYKEKYTDVVGYRMPLKTKYPVIWVQYTRGLQYYNFLFKGRFDYNKIDFKLQKSFYIKYLGQSSFQLVSGYSDGNLPYCNLYTGRSSFVKGFPVYASNSFATMRMNEFLSDKYAALFFTHNFKKLLLKTKFFQPQLAVVNNIVFGTLNYPESHNNISFKTLEKGYYECGITLNSLFTTSRNNSKNPLSSYGVGVFYRYGPYSYDNINNNFALKLTLVITNLQ